MPSSLSAQVYFQELLTLVKLFPWGGESSPYLAPTFLSLSSIDQQWMELSSFMPHMWPPPALMAVRTGIPQAASPAIRAAAANRAIRAWVYLWRVRVMCGPVSLVRCLWSLFSF